MLFVKVVSQGNNYSGNLNINAVDYLKYIALHQHAAAIIIANVISCFKIATNVNITWNDLQVCIPFKVTYIRGA